VEEVGVDRRTALDLLRRAGEVDRRSQEVLLAVEEEKHFDGVVLVALEAAEVGLVGATVHHRAAVGVDRAAVLSDDGMPQAPSHGASLAILPSLGRGLRHPVDEELGVLGRLDDPFLGNVIGRFSEHRAGVGVRAAHEQLLHVKVRQALGDALPQCDEHIVREPDDVAGDHDRRIERAVAFARLERHHLGRDRALDGTRDPRVHLTPQGHRLSMRNVRFRHTDIEIRSLARRRDDNRRRS